MRILLTNDDGWDAPGIVALHERFATLGEVIRVGPAQNSSGGSAAITLQRPLKLKEHAPNVYSVDGFTADCVQLALLHLYSADRQPDIIISGINAGSNLGCDVWYSGTVAGAMEGRFLRLPSIAVSVTNRHPEHYATAANVAAHLYEYVQQRAWPAHTILNVNVPDVPAADLKGLQWCQHGHRQMAANVEPIVNPRGAEFIWLGLAGAPAPTDVQDDFKVVANGFAAVTPITLQLTNQPLMAQLNSTDLNEGLVL